MAKVGNLSLKQPGALHFFVFIVKPAARNLSHTVVRRCSVSPKVFPQTITSSRYTKKLFQHNPLKTNSTKRSNVAGALPSPKGMIFRWNRPCRAYRMRSFLYLVRQVLPACNQMPNLWYKNTQNQLEHLTYMKSTEAYIFAGDD